MVCNGDVLTTLNIKQLLDYHFEKGGIATIAMHQRVVNINLGVIHCDDDNELTDYVEKPSIEYMVSMGIYVFNKAVLKYIQSNTYLDFTNLIFRRL